MKILNPHYSDPLIAWANANKDAVNNWLASAPRLGMKEISFDYIRANVAAAAGKSDGELAQLFQLLGITVTAS
jgi:AraC-like DNA-binding protein